MTTLIGGLLVILPIYVSFILLAKTLGQVVRLHALERPRVAPQPDQAERIRAGAREEVARERTATAFMVLERRAKSLPRRRAFNRREESVSNHVPPAHLQQISLPLRPQRARRARVRAAHPRRRRRRVRFVV